MSRIARLMPTVFNQRTYENMLNNGSFEDNGNAGVIVSGWTKYFLEAAVHAVTDTAFVLDGVYGVKCTYSDPSSYNITYQSVAFVAGRKYYMSIDLMSTIDLASNINFGIRTMDVITIKSTYTATPVTGNVAESLSLVHTAASGENSLAFIRGSDATGVAYFDRFICIDLTDTFGSGNEPNAAWCDANIRPFVTF